MTKAYIRHISVGVAVGAVLFSHWVRWLRAPGGHGPLSFVLALGLAIMLVTAWAIAANCRGSDRPPRHS